MVILGNAPLSLLDLKKISIGSEKIGLANDSLQQINSVYTLIKEKALGNDAIYGLNTGFGALAEQKISPPEQVKLQENIIVSHAVGVGSPLPVATARLMMALRLNTLLKGFSGASPQLIQTLSQLLDAQCTPYVPRTGSVGASGDLAPLAHTGLLLLGLGPAYLQEQQVTAAQALKAAGLEPLSLGVRDGLALINGTQAMAASGAIALLKSKELVDLADMNAACTLDALGGHITPFDARIHAIKPHPGQITSAAHVRRLTAQRSVQQYIKNPLTQDPYSLRCVPQVHGATRDTIDQAEVSIMTEVNGVSDNPLFFIENSELDILSGGNFHGQSLALAMDYLAMAVAELANIAERRIELMLNPKHSNGLPPFLAAESGLNSGYMMLHVSASALVSENKILCHPASVDSIPTSANREDHVSMGMTAANKLHQVIENTKTVLAIEMLAAHQALDFRTPQSCGEGVLRIHESFRTMVAFRHCDGLYIEDLAQALSWIDRADSNLLINNLPG